MPVCYVGGIPVVPAEVLGVIHFCSEKAIAEQLPAPKGQSYFGEQEATPSKNLAVTAIARLKAYDDHYVAFADSSYYV